MLLLALSTGCNPVEQTPVPQAPAQQVPHGNVAQTSSALDALFAEPPRGITSYRLGPEGNPSMLILAVNPQAFEPQLIAAPGEGISARDAIQRFNLQLVIGSGFVSTMHSLQPVGLLQLEGRTLSPIETHGYTRILGVSDHGLGVVHRQAYERDIFHSALQAGPGIIEKGQLDISERDLQRPTYFRSFIGLCADVWLAGISFKPVHLRTLGEELLAFTQTQAWQCQEVVNLAGDRQAVLMLRNGQQSLDYHGDINTHKVSLLGFAAKSAER